MKFYCSLSQIKCSGNRDFNSQEKKMLIKFSSCQNKETIKKHVHNVSSTLVPSELICLVFMQQELEKKI